MKIAILGCGPSGLVAAHAIVTHFGGDHSVNLFSQKRKSPIHGAQYLHQPIPGVPIEVQADPNVRGRQLPARPTVIRYRMVGTPESYLKKVYGAMWDGSISDDLRDQAHIAWDLRGTYDWLWKTYEPGIVDQFFPDKPEYIAEVMGVLDEQFDLVINTIPRPALCAKRDEHSFKHTEIWAGGDTDGGDSPIPGQDNIITYNGDESPSWYRVSRIYGHTTVEWPGHINRPPFPGTARVRKPLAHNCNCWPEVEHLGRMGRWQNGRLVHHVYADTVELITIRESEAAA